MEIKTLGGHKNVSCASKSFIKDGDLGILRCVRVTRRVLIIFENLFKLKKSFFDLLPSILTGACEVALLFADVALFVIFDFIVFQVAFFDPMADFFAVETLLFILRAFFLEMALFFADITFRSLIRRDYFLLFLRLSLSGFAFNSRTGPFRAHRLERLAQLLVLRSLAQVLYV